MRRQIRHGVFETNSSSVHSIAIPKELSIVDVPLFMSFRTGKFGWEFAEVDPADYFYTALYETSSNEEEFGRKFSKLKSILDKYNINYSFKTPETHIFYWPERGTYHLVLDDGYIDHSDELGDWVDDLLNDGEKLVRFISAGKVFTGNDNCGTELEDLFIEDPRYEWFYKTN